MIPIISKKLGTKLNFIAAYCCCMIFFFSFSSIGYAMELSMEEMAYLRTKETIVFVSQTQYPPFEFVDANGQHEGMMLDIIRWMAVEIGFKPVFMDMTFQQAQEAVLSGKADILTSLFYSDQRKHKFEFTEPLFDVPASIFVKAERTDIKDIKDLNSKTISIQRGDYAGDFLKSQNIRFDTLDTKDFLEATNMVLSGKADAVIGDEQIVLYHIFSNRLTDAIKKAGKPLYIGKNCMASNPSNALLIRILNKGIGEAKKSGGLDKIGTKWLGTIYNSPKPFLDRYRWYVAAVVSGILLILLLVWVWNIRLRILVRKKTADITRREQALRQSEERFRKLFICHAAIKLVIDPETGTIIDANEAAAQFYEWPIEELKQMRIQQINMLPPEAVKAEMEKAATSESARFEFRHRRADGSVRNVEVFSNKIEIAGKGLLYSIVHDITERKRAELALLKSKHFLRTTALSANIALLDEQGTILLVNKAWQDFAEQNGLPAEKVSEGRNYLEVCDHASGRNIEEAIPFADGIRAVLTGVAESFMLEYPCHSPGEERWFIGRVMPFPGIGPRHVVVAHENITERKRLEKERLLMEMRLLRLEKTESLDRMAGAVAHHFNNQLSVVLGNLGMAMEDLTRDVGAVQGLNKAMKAARKAAEMSRLMLTYLGQASGRRESLDLSEVCSLSLPMIQAAMPKHMVLETDLQVPGPAVNSNANQIQQVLTNLITNAWEAAAENQGAIGLTVKTVSQTNIPASKRFPIDWQPQESVYACLEVRDTGCGIADKDIDKFFDPFFSTKFTGRGLGLPVVLGIVGAHGGRCLSR